jgi:hypothetical protein
MTIDYDFLHTQFLKVAQLSGFDLLPCDIRIETGPSAHRSQLLKGKMACYVFYGSDRCWKVGKVGPNSGPRFSHQHYNPGSSMSNLSKSLLACSPSVRPYPDGSLDESTVGDWIRSNFQRVNFYLSAEQPLCLLTLLEAFLQCQLRPHFEGKPS